MKKSIAKRWAKALRSGKYKQTRGKLRGQRGYCCLGVLCDIRDSSSWDNDVAYAEYDGEDSELTADVAVWAGMSSCDGTFSNKLTKGGNRQSLVTLNDNWKWSFKKIAAFIEKNYRKL